MSQLEGGAQRTFGIFDPGPVSFVDDQDVGDLQDAGLDGLDLIAHARGFDDERGMRQTSHIHFALSCAYRFDNDNLVACGGKDLYDGSRLLRKAAQRATRSHRADENARIAGQVTHAYAVT